MVDYEADAPRPKGSEQPNRGPDIERLLALLEAADEGSRELDAEIGALVGLCDLHLDDGTWFYGLDLNDDHGPWEECPSYTASLDAALTLVPADAFWRVGHDGEGKNPADFRATVLHKEYEPARAVRAMPALALCSAALKARMRP